MRDATPRIPDRDGHRAVLRSHLDFGTPTGIERLSRIEQEVQKDALEGSVVPQHMDRSGLRTRRFQRRAPLFERRLRCVDRRLERGENVDGSRPDTPAASHRQCIAHSVVEAPDLLQGAALYLAQWRPVRQRFLHPLKIHANGGERIPNLMGEGRRELAHRGKCLPIGQLAQRTPQALSHCVKGAGEPPDLVFTLLLHLALEVTP